MADTTEIAWCDSTFNPWIGCTKVGPGCDNCYAKADFDDRRHRVVWGAGNPRSRTKTWNDPVRWNAQHATFFAEHGRKRRVFCASLADVFDNEVDPSWRMDLFELIAKTPNLDWLILTKRIGNVMPMCSGDALMFDQLANIWLGATVVNQEEADRDIPKLLQIPAKVRFLSLEPLLELVDLEFNEISIALEPDGHGNTAIVGGIDWLIVGGESGTKARPMNPAWARSLRDQCAAADVPFFFKQWGEFAPNWLNDDSGNKIAGSEWIDRMGKKIAGRMLDSKLHDEFPVSK